MLVDINQNAASKLDDAREKNCMRNFIICNLCHAAYNQGDSTDEDDMGGS